MGLDKLSKEYYKVGTRKEISETAKIAKISLIILVLSFILLKLITSDLTLLLTSDFLLFVFIFLSMVFILTLLFSTIMIFISKQPSRNIFLSIICYILLGVLIVLTCVSFVYAFKFGYELGSAGGKFSTDKLASKLDAIIDKLNNNSTIITILTFLFDVSILFSFELKSFEDNYIDLLAFGIYILLTLIKPLIMLATQLPIGSEIFIYLIWLVCISLILKDRTVDVECVVLVDEEGKETQKKQPKKINIKDFLYKYSIIFKIAVVYAIISLSKLTFTTKGLSVLIPTGVGALLIGFSVYFAFYTLSGKKLRKIDYIGCFSTIFGMVSLLIIYLLLDFISLALIVALCTLNLIALIFGLVIFFFFQKGAKKGRVVIKCILLVIISIILLYYIFCLIFSPELRYMLEFVLPLIFNVYTVSVALVYFIQSKSYGEILDEIEDRMIENIINKKK